jgi:trimethylamine--corrinoid protein Co-methyltransferase
MNDVAKPRRKGARAARRAERMAPLARSERPVLPGLPGGRYQPLSEAEMQRVHQAVLEVLEDIGLSQAIPSCIESVTAAGGYINRHGRLSFPRALVEDTIARAARNFVLHAGDPVHDMDLSGSRVHYGTAGAAVHIVDSETREYRDSTLADLYDAARLVDSLDNIHFFQRPLVARDMESSRELDINTCYACISGTRKHVGTSWVKPEHVDETLRMLHWIAGDEQQWRARPFVSMSSCFVVPPLRFAEDACACLEAAVRGGMPVLLLAAGQAGATSPAALAGALVQEVAEVLAGLVYVNLLVPGHPAIFGTWPFISDLRTGAMSGGSGEQAVLMAACAQMANFYDLPGGVAAGMADAKLPDAQSGYEKAYTTTLAGHAGANLVYEAAGMQASLLGFSLEGLVIDNDMLGAVQRTIRGIEINEDSLSLSMAAMRRVCIGGPNHFLGDAQTMALMQKDYIYPEIADRSSPKEWAEQGSPDILQRARERCREILAGHYPDHIAADIDARIREALPIRLPRERMRPAR